MLKRSSSSSADPGNISSYDRCVEKENLLSEQDLPVFCGFGPLRFSMLLSRFILDIPHDSLSRKYLLSFFSCLSHHQGDTMRGKRSEIVIYKANLLSDVSLVERNIICLQLYLESRR